jgi:hypothetical protein
MTKKTKLTISLSIIGVLIIVGGIFFGYYQGDLSSLADYFDGQQKLTKKQINSRLDGAVKAAPIGANTPCSIECSSSSQEAEQVLNSVSLDGVEESDACAIRCRKGSGFDNTFRGNSIASVIYQVYVEMNRGDTIFLAENENMKKGPSYFGSVGSGDFSCFGDKVCRYEDFVKRGSKPNENIFERRVSIASYGDKVVLPKIYKSKYATAQGSDEYTQDYNFSFVGQDKIVWKEDLGHYVKYDFWHEAGDYVEESIIHSTDGIKELSGDFDTLVE